MEAIKAVRKAVIKRPDHIALTSPAEAIKAVRKAVIKQPDHMTVTSPAVTSKFVIQRHHHYHHLSLKRKGRSGITDDNATSFLHFFSVFHCPLGPAEPQVCPFPDVIFPPLPLSALLSSSPFHCALQDGLDQT